MKILVIGNGFDLAHGLPTSYSDFLDFIKAWKEFDYSKSAELEVFKDFCEHFKNTEIFSEIAEHINTNSELLEYFLSIYNKRCADGKRGWIDFEREISTIIQAFDYARLHLINERYNDHEEDFPLKIRLIMEAVLQIDKDEKGKEIVLREDIAEGRAASLLDGLDRLTRLLEIYLYYYVSKIEVNKCLPEFADQKYTHVLSFNYTDTYKRLYDHDGDAKYCYIHGVVKNNSSLEDCNLVLGIDEFLDTIRIDTDNSFVRFKKFYQRINKETGTEYVDWCNKIEENARIFKKTNPPKNEVHIYGHSLDVTDKDILAMLILGTNTTTYIYYYSREDKSQKIENLIKIVGEEELIRRTRGINRSVRFVKTGVAIEK